MGEHVHLPVCCRYRRVLLVAVAVMAFGFAACGEPGEVGDAGVIPQVDTSPDWCTTVDPIRLPGLFALGGAWYETDTANLIDRVGDRRDDDVWLDGLGTTAVALGDEAWDGISDGLINVSGYRFEPLEVAATSGGTVYIQVFEEGEEFRTKGLVWIDSAGDVHFLGDCAWMFWTEPFAQFAESIGWAGTEEQLLRRVIEDETYRQRLNDVYASGPAPPTWDERSPMERSTFDDDMPEALEAELDSGVVVVEIPDSWLNTDTLLCTFVPGVAWNVCIPLTEWSTLGSPAEIESYYRPGQAIEVWLLDETDPARGVLLGEVTFSGGQESLTISLVDPAPAVRVGDQWIAPEATESWFQLSE